MDLLWLAFGVAFLALEYVGYRLEGTRGTLSGLVWAWADERLWRRALVLLACILLAAHLVWGITW